MSIDNNDNENDTYVVCGQFFEINLCLQIQKSVFFVIIFNSMRRKTSGVYLLVVALVANYKGDLKEKKKSS